MLKLSVTASCHWVRMRILVTGGAGFIGSAVIRHILTNTSDSVVNVDKLTYAANLESLAEFTGDDRYAFERVDICDAAALTRVFAAHAPEAVMHLAAESHVDRSIAKPVDFLHTNVFGTYQLLETCRAYLAAADTALSKRFRLHHVSTDEVFGDLDDDADPFTEESRYLPSSPYAASKAGSDHLVRAWARTYRLPVIVTNTSNNYGPNQYPEKLIPLAIRNAVDGKTIPVYGRGEQRREWLYVEDHAEALHRVIREAGAGSSFNIGSGQELRNIDVIEAICSVLEALAPEKPAGVERYADLVGFVDDRPGHDSRYAIDSEKIRAELGWEAGTRFEDGLRKTVRWYLGNPARRCVVQPAIA